MYIQLDAVLILYNEFEPKGQPCPVFARRHANGSHVLSARLARHGRLFFSLLLLIIFSWKSKSDWPSQENQQLKEAKQNTVEPDRYRALNH